MLTDITNEKEICYNGSVHHEGFKFHWKYVEKISCTYWRAIKRCSDSPCTAKIKINSLGKVIKLKGKHDQKMFLKQENYHKVMGFIEEDENENSPPDLSQVMLERAEEIILKNLSIQPKKIHLQVPQEMEM